MSERDPWGVLTEGVMPTFPTRGAAVQFQSEHAVFWGRRSPLMTLDGDQWVPADAPTHTASQAGVPLGEVE